VKVKLNGKPSTPNGVFLILLSLEATDKRLMLQVWNGRVPNWHLKYGNGSIRGCQSEIVAMQKQTQTNLVPLL
jgi:hypothetical protein